MKHGPLRVIIVDDTRDTRLLMRAYLDAELPAAVRVQAIDDENFQDAVNWGQAAVAIVDLMMPNNEGRVILEWLRENYPDCCRIAWSAAPDLGSTLVEEGLAAAVIAKPGLDELRDLVIGAL